MKRLFFIAACLLLASSPAFAAKQTLNAADTGAQSRTKQNANFTELYSLAIASPWLAQSTAPSIHNVFWVDTSGASPAIKYWDGDSWEVAAAGDGGAYTLPVATSSVLGGVKQGSGTSIAADGTISVTSAGLGLGTSDNPSFNSVHASGGNLAAANKQVTKSWQTGLPYTADVTSVIHGGKHWIAKTTHTAGSTTEPGVGASYTDAWTEVTGGSTDLSNYLSKTNTTAYTPTADYHPSTKKYVDDAITAGGGYTDEMAQDAVGGMFAGNTETGIAVTYDDATGKVNFVVATQFDGTQNTTGSAAKLTTARTIGGVSFDGSANINLPGVNTTGNQNTSGTSAGLTAQYIDWNSSSGGSSIANKPSISGLAATGITGTATFTKTGTTARTFTLPDAAGTVALTSDIVAAPTDATITTTDVTTNNASTSKHGWLLKATAPSSGLRNIVAIDNGETVYKNAALFDATSPSTQAFGDAAAVGTALTGARRDHKHAMPAAQTATTTAFTPNGSIAATTVQAAIQEVRDEAGGSFDPASPGAIGGTTPAAGTFTTVTAATYASSAADGSRRSILPNNATIACSGGGEEEIYNEGGAIKACENDTEYDVLLSRDVGTAVQAYDADLADLADGSLTGTKVGFADTDSVWTATDVQSALEEMNNSINAGAPNGTGAKVHWSQLLGVPAGFADGSDDGSGGGITHATSDGTYYASRNGAWAAFTSGNYTLAMTLTGNTAVTLPTSGTLITTDSTATLTNKSVTAVEVDGSAAGTLTAAQVSGTIVTNRGQAASDVALTLPTAAAGYNALFTVGTAQSNKWGVRAGTNDKIYLLAADGTISAGSDNGYARMTAAQVGQVFACWTFQTGSSAWDWQCKASAIGTSTFAAN
jgi:hypothetical protein